MVAPTRALSSARQAVKAAVDLDVALVVPSTGAVTALPVVALFALGLSVSTPATASGLALGALFVGLAARMNAPRLPVSTMVADALGLSLSALVGAACSPYAWLHFGSLVLWCFAGGLLVALGPVRSVVGIQGVMAIIIFGRAPQSLHQAVVLALLVLAGGFLQTVVQLVARLPVGLRPQRRSVAQVYLLLAELAGDHDATGSRAIAEAMDRALATMRSSTLYGRADVQALRGLVDEARRMRFELIALQSLSQRVANRAKAEATIEVLRQQCGGSLTDIARRLAPSLVPDTTGPWPKASWPGLQRAVSDIDALIAEEQDASQLRGPVSTHIGALAGQLRASAKLVDRATDLAPARIIPHVQASQLSWSDATKSTARALADSLSLSSSACRHAIRLAVVVPVLDLSVTHSSLPHSYWIPLTAAVVLRPDFGATLTRGIARLGGSLVGVGLAGVLLASLHPGDVVTTVLVAVLAWLTFTFYQANYAIGVTFLTGLVLALVSVGQTDSLGTAGYRLLDTLIGGTVALVAYMVWPTWSKEEALSSLGALVTAQRRYVKSVLDTLNGQQRLDPDRLRDQGRSARLAFSAAESAVGRSLNEPTTKQVDPEESRSIIAALRRLIRAAHSLRTELSDGNGPGAPDPMARLTADIDQSMAMIAEALTHDGLLLPLPHLRQRYDEVRDALTDGAREQHVLVQLDELVDAVDTVGHVLGADIPEAVSDP